MKKPDTSTRLDVTLERTATTKRKQIPEVQTRIVESQGFDSWTAGLRVLGDGLSRRLWFLESEALCAEAMRRTGLENFGEPPIEPALSILVDSLEREANLHPLGRFLMRTHLRQLLETRLRLTQAWSEQSDALATSPIQWPIFITGLPRSGSTFLHELLAEDPKSRAPRVWEVMHPLPIHNGMGSKMDRRIQKTEAQLRWFRRLAPEADAVYPMRAWTPHECVAIHSYALLSQEFVSTCHIPTYRAFLETVDLRTTYSWQKRFLQHLQLHSPTRRWVLKSPDHVYGLEELLEVFPDGVIIQTHRNPLEVLRSSIELTRVLQGLFGRVSPREQVAVRDARMLAASMERITRFRDNHPELAKRFIDVKYGELVSDPLAVVHRIYEHLGLGLSAATAERMQQMASNRSRYRKHPASPALADLELSGMAETRAFENYCERFEIACQEKKENLAQVAKVGEDD
jgi:LPS sulfotransferase NodH